MKHLLTYLVLCVILAVGFGCAKKKYPESVIENAPVYYSKFDVNGKPMEFNAGDNNFYMYADVTKDTANVNEHSSTLRRSDCGGCGPSLKFVIRDYAISDGGHTTKIDSTIHKGNYEYLGAVKGPQYQVQFAATQSGKGIAMNYDWDFGDGQKVSGSNVTHTFTKSGLNKVCVSLKTTNGCISNMCNDHNMSSNGMNCFLTATADSANRVRFSASVTGGTPQYTYYWEFGDGMNIKGNASVFHDYTYAGSYLARLTATDASGNKVIAQYNVVTKLDPSSCGVNFNRTSIQEISGLKQTLSKVGVIYTDEQGVSYQTIGNDQPQASYFEILDIKEGEVNENGRPTKIVNVRFNCEVYNGSQKLILSNGLSTISVAY